MTKEINDINESEGVQAKATVSVTLYAGQVYQRSARVDLLTGKAKITVKNNGKGGDITASIVDPTWLDEAVKIYTVKPGTTLSTTVTIPKNRYYLELGNPNRLGLGSGTLGPA